MSMPVKMIAFVVGLVAVFAAALGVGRAVGPGPANVAAVHAPADHAAGEPGIAAGAAQVPDGLQVEQDGYRLVPTTGSLSVGRAAPFTFQVAGPDGQPVTSYTATHERHLHLIVASRDLTGYHHLHPRLAPDGTWSVPFAVNAAGQYRVLADFQPAGRGEAMTLGVDVPAPGDYRPAPLPPASRTVTVDDYTVTLSGDLVPGTASKVTLAVHKDGAPVTDLQPYLGAYGHLVALRDGDLAYLHVHPDGAPGDGRTEAGPTITFYADVPSTGAYRLFLDFQHAGTVRTAAFTAVAGDRPAPPASGAQDTGSPAPPPSGTHSDDGHGHD